MTMKLNRSAFEQLVRENIAWLEKTPRTLERDHIIEILKDSSTLYYDAEQLALVASQETPDLDQLRILARRILNVTEVRPAELITLRCTCSGTKLTYDGSIPPHEPQCAMSHPNVYAFMVVNFPR